MDWLTFISSIVGQLAWPLTTLAAFFLFKKPIIDALPKLNKLKYRELTAEFENALSQTEQVADDAGLNHIIEGEIVEQNLDKLNTILRVSPNAAIAEAFREVELEVSAALQRNGKLKETIGKSNRINLFRQIALSELLSEGGVGVLERLRDLRNKAAHSELYKLDAEIAKEYIEISSWMIAYLKEL